MFIEFVLDTFQRCFNSENFWIGVPSILFYFGGLKNKISKWEYWLWMTVRMAMPFQLKNTTIYTARALVGFYVSAFFYSYFRCQIQLTWPQKIYSPAMQQRGHQCSLAASKPRSLHLNATKNHSHARTQKVDLISVFFMHIWYAGFEIEKKCFGLRLSLPPFCCFSLVSYICQILSTK